MRKYRTLLLMIVSGIILTVIAREHAVNHRLSLGLQPSWGGEYLILPLFLVMYSALKADWSVE